MIEADALTRLGTMVRELRRERTLTVEALAESAGVSAGLISQIERGKGNPSFSSLFKLSAALGVPLGTFMSDPASGGNGKVVRKDERKRLEMAEKGLVYELLSPDLQRDLQVMISRLPPHFPGVGEPFRHPGEEFQLVLAGEVEVFVGDEKYVLSTGDGITFDSGVPHWHRNPGDEWVELLGAVTPPNL